MGMYTTIIDTDGSDYQIKTGFDDLATYHVGDTIEWQPDPFWPGCHVDGVHDGSGATCTVWVVIKDRKVVAVEPWGRDPAELAEKYGIQEPDRSLWTEEQWEAEAERKRKAEADYQAWKKENPDAGIAAYYIRCKLNEPSFAEQILKLKEEEND